jgi:hypothetical protein
MSNRDFGAGRSKKIDQFLYDRLTERHFKFWIDFTSMFPLPFHRPSSSSKKYHKDKEGNVHTLEDHTYEMLVFADIMLPIFGDTRAQQNYDIVLLSIALHDIQKYGIGNEQVHTNKEHGVITSKYITNNGLRYGLTEEESKLLSRLVKLHDGRWNSLNKGFYPIQLDSLELFVHMADYASSRRILKFD